MLGLDLSSGIVSMASTDNLELVVGARGEYTPMKNISDASILTHWIGVELAINATTTPKTIVM